MGELGWLGIPIPEAYGGAGMGLAELAVVMEALGRTLAPEPFLSSVLLGGGALALGGSEAQKEQWLPKLVEGDALLALAQQEPRSRYDLHRVATRAEREGSGWRIRGEKIQVEGGATADWILVVARTEGDETDRDGISIFGVRRDATELHIERQQRVDSRPVARLRFDGVAVSDEDVVGAPGAAGPLLRRVVDRATAGLCAEMLGSMSEAFARTLTYMKQRVQFGAPIGSFQALKHRAAEEFIEIELCRSATLAAARALDAEQDDAEALVSLAKARCSEAGLLVANESVQMHGGIGMTDEHDIGFYFKRARAADATFGDAAYHRDRWARLREY
jgi:alkylation response protein AidB-like acyl-CoA dehydrogenase